MSEEPKVSHAALVQWIGSLREKLQRLSLPSDSDSPKSEKLQILEITEKIDEMLPSLRVMGHEEAQARFAAIANRIAVHFFVEQSMPRFCRRVLEELTEDTGAGTAALILFGTDIHGAQVIAACGVNKEDLSPSQLRVSRTILSKIRHGEESVLIADALSDELLALEESVDRLNLRSVLAIPLRIQHYLAGAIYLENEREVGAFGEDDRSFLLATGRLVAIYLNAAFRLGDEVAARRRIYDEIKGKTHFDGIVGNSPSLMKVLETVAQVGPSDATVILEGESGTGKELIARALHLSSKRSRKPFVVVNCAAIPETLLESELFGHERGAFTGALDKRVGRFELAHEGSLFLDEVGELPLPMQAKLLRFLQNREVERLGSSRTMRIDTRLIAATNRDLQSMVRRGEFREDLYYRLHVVPIRVPALRDRQEDIPLLVEHFSRIFALQSGRKVPEIDSAVYECLQQYRWPGNVRELENAVQRMVVLSQHDRLQVRDLPPELAVTDAVTLELGKNPFGRFLVRSPRSYEQLKQQRHEIQRITSIYTQMLEDRFIDAILERAGGNVTRAAQQAGIHRTMIHRNLKTRSIRDS